MSAKNRKGPSRPQDVYPTATSLIEAALLRLREDFPEFKPTNFLEPGSGQGPFCDVVEKLKRAYPTIEDRRAIDISPQRVSSAHQFLQADFLTWSATQRYDFIATNPPYTVAKDFIRKSLELLQPGGLALFLLRLNFLGSLDRQVLWRWDVDLHKVYVLPSRPSFTEDGKTDATEYAWFLFAGRQQPTVSWI